METNLKIAIQKSGRLKDDSLKLLEECGITIDNGRDQLKAKAVNFPVEVFYLRNSDIPQYLEDGVVDCAIIGENTLVENNSQAVVIEKLGFSKCRLSIAVPKASSVSSLAELNGMRIATSYNNTLSKFMTI